MATAPKAVPKAVPKVVPASESEPAPAKKSRFKLFLILGLVVVLLGAAGGAAWYFFMDRAPAAGAKKVAEKKKSEPPVFVNLDTFTVNLQNDGAGDQFLQTNMSLQVGKQNDVEDIKLYMPQVRNRLLLLLSSKKASDLASVEGKKKLAEEIIAQLRQPFPPSGATVDVTNVFFTSFVIQ